MDGSAGSRGGEEDARAYPEDEEINERKMRKEITPEMRERKSDKCRGGPAGMTNRALIYNGDCQMMRANVFITRKGRESALQAMKINYEEN